MGACCGKGKPTTSNAVIRKKTTRSFKTTLPKEQENSFKPEEITNYMQSCSDTNIIILTETLKGKSMSIRSKKGGESGKGGDLDTLSIGDHLCIQNNTSSIQYYLQQTHPRVLFSRPVVNSGGIKWDHGDVLSQGLGWLQDKSILLEQRYMWRYQDLIQATLFAYFKGKGSESAGQVLGSFVMKDLFNALQPGCKEDFISIFNSIELAHQIPLTTSPYALWSMLYMI